MKSRTHALTATLALALASAAPAASPLSSHQGGTNMLAKCPRRKTALLPGQLSAVPPDRQSASVASPLASGQPRKASTAASSVSSKSFWVEAAMSAASGSVIRAVSRSAVMS